MLRLLQDFWNRRIPPIVRQWVGSSFFLLLLFVGTAIALPILSTGSVAQPVSQQATAGTLRQQARQLYERGEYEAAIAKLQQAAMQLQASGNILAQGLVLGNLSLAYQAVGEWEAAEAAIAQGLKLLETVESSPSTLRAIAGTLEIRSQLEFAVGKPEASLDLLQAAIDLYEQLEDAAGRLRVGVNQSFVLQEVGRDRAALKQLLPLLPTLLAQPDSLLSAIAFRSLGNVLRGVGDEGMVEEVLADFWERSPDRNLDDLDKSRQLLQRSLEIAEKLQSSQDIARAHFSLGNTERAAYFRTQDAWDRSRALGPTEEKVLADTLVSFFDAAADRYRQAERTATTPLLRLQAQLNYFSLLVDFERYSSEVRDRYAELEERAATNSSQLQQFQNLVPQFAELPVSRAGIYAEINFVESLLTLGKTRQQFEQLPGNEDLATLLADAIAESRKTLGDRRAESYATGMLGKLYAAQEQWQDAQQLTQEAILLADAAKAPDILYQWQWQLGRVLHQMRADKEAIAAYEEAIATLDIVRQDLLSLKNADTRFLFRDDVEPAYRELVDLLLPPTVEKIEPAQLEKSLYYIDSLKFAELEDFLRCSLRSSSQINPQKEGVAALQDHLNAVADRDPHLAFLYTIVLHDRVTAILKLPQPQSSAAKEGAIAPPRQFLLSRTHRVPEQELRETVDEARKNVESPTFFLQPTEEPLQKLYQWLIADFEPYLQKHNIKTLAFILDKDLQRIPMATLHDGNQFLIQKGYSVTFSPSIQLLQPRTFNLEGSQILIAGATKKRTGFESLVPGVPDQIEKLKQVLKQFLANYEILENGNFTTSELKNRLISNSYNIIHFITHGQFRSSFEETHILTDDESQNWQDYSLDINELAEMLQQSSSEIPLELLVFSACESASGDSRAMLGMSGMAVKSGALGTVGALWFVEQPKANDLMEEFYKKLMSGNISKAKALRQAQLEMITQKPRRWAPFILVGY